MLVQYVHRLQVLQKYPGRLCVGSLNIEALHRRDRAPLNVAICRELVPTPSEGMALFLMSEALPCGSGIFMGWESVIPMTERFLSLPQALTEKNKIMYIAAVASQILEIPGPG